MSTLLWSLIGIALFVHLARSLLAIKSWSAPTAEFFSGELLTVGDNLVCIPERDIDSQLSEGSPTVICFPGLLEDMRYFLKVHRETPARLIIIDNANYQNPFGARPSPEPVWWQGNPHKAGTIAHDAFCMVKVVEHFAKDSAVYLHGHSRGGAVVLEAGRQQPDLFRVATAVLEAAVVPQGRLANNAERFLQPVGLYLLPFVFTVLRLLPEEKRRRALMIRKPTAYKNKLVAAFPYTPKQYATVVLQVADIIQWQLKSDASYYEHFAAVCLIAGERDQVLWRKAMLASARQSVKAQVIETRGTDHFPSLEKPEQVSALFAKQLAHCHSMAAEELTE